MLLRAAAYWICCLILFSSGAFAQGFLTGRIHKKSSPEVLTGVSVQNHTRKKYNLSDMGGNYKIPAEKGDTLIFSSAGYEPDTLIVRSYMFYESLTIELSPNLVLLPYMKVDEESNYRIDSLVRRNEYRFLLDRKHPIKLMNEKRPTDATGLSFSPLGYYSKTERRKRKLMVWLTRQEKEYYIDYKFPRAYVARLTRLREDSLQLFMYRYRPSYEFCRKASGQDILFYINDNLKKFRLGSHSSTSKPTYRRTH
jgi:hypothetical protein